MNKRMLMSAVAGLALTAATPALADVNVLANIDVQKDKSIVEMINKDKDIFLRIEVAPTVEKFTESNAAVNQDQVSNSASDNNVRRVDVIDTSAVGNNGLMSVNQAAGNLNNQGNAISAAVSADVPAGGVGFAESQASAQQLSESNFLGDDIASRDAEILSSLNTNTGVLHANQSTGNLNNQSNTLSLTVALAPGAVVLTEADLGQSNSGNVVSTMAESSAVARLANLDTSVNGNSGVIGVNQSSGSLGNQANVVSFGVATLTP